MEKEKVTEELVRQNGNQAAAVMADYAGQGGEGGEGGEGGGGGGGSTGGATISSVVTPQEATEEQRNAVSAALTAAGVNGKASGRFIPAASIDDMPLAIADVDEGGAGVLFLRYYHRERGLVNYVSTSASVLGDDYIVIDGGFGSWEKSQIIG